MMLSVSAGAYIEKRDDGRMMVLCAAGEEVDITEKLTEEGVYHFEKSMERTWRPRSKSAPRLSRRRMEHRTKTAWSTALW